MPLPGARVVGRRYMEVPIRPEYKYGYSDKERGISYNMQYQSASKYGIGVSKNYYYPNKAEKMFKVTQEVKINQSDELKY